MARTTLTHLTKKRKKLKHSLSLFQIRPAKLNIILRPGNSLYLFVINALFCDTISGQLHSLANLARASLCLLRAVWNLHTLRELFCQRLRWRRVRTFTLIVIATMPRQGASPRHNSSVLFLPMTCCGRW